MLKFQPLKKINYILFWNEIPPCMSNVVFFNALMPMDVVDYVVMLECIIRNL
jgi:hypothetical protein